MLPVSSCMSIYSKRATIACHGFLRGQKFSLEHMIDCIVGHGGGLRIFNFFIFYSSPHVHKYRMCTSVCKFAIHRNKRWANRNENRSLRIQLRERASPSRVGHNLPPYDMTGGGKLHSQHCEVLPAVCTKGNLNVQEGQPCNSSISLIGSEC